MSQLDGSKNRQFGRSGPILFGNWQDGALVGAVVGADDVGADEEGVGAFVVAHGTSHKTGHVLLTVSTH